MPERKPNSRQLLREALLSGFRKYETLRIFVADNFESLELDQISSSQQGLETVADELIRHFEEIGDVSNLVENLIKARPRNSKVQILKNEIGLIPQAIAITVFSEQLIEADGVLANSVVVKESVVPEELIEPDHLAHLVVAVFWKGEKKLQKFQIRPKLCYRDHATRQVMSVPLLKEEDIDGCSVSQKEVPDFLKGIHAFGLTRLRQLFPDLDHAWNLSIELFLPVDLLCLPLSAWCGQDGELLSKVTVVVGCSDRFDPNRPDKALELHNQLQKGWKRFRDKVPDRLGNTLRDLDWLDSNQAARKSLAAYAGFRCYGNWLKSGEWEKLDSTSQKRWQDLVEFGIPLALWICQGSPSSSMRVECLTS
jgi:hypothetical protein